MQTQKEKEIDQYIEEWVNSRYSDWYLFYHDVNKHRRNGIYQLKHGTRLCDLLNSIMGNIEDHLCTDNGGNIIPAKFSSIQHFLRFVSRFKEYLETQKFLITDNICGESTNYIVTTMLSMADSLLAMFDRCISVYGEEEQEILPSPYSDMRKYLIEGKVTLFVKSLKAAINTIPYEVRRIDFQESHYHMIVHSIMTVLGFQPTSELVLADGRIDMQVEFLNTVYIFEFKYSKEGKQKKNEALEQIIKDEYAGKEQLYKNKTVIAVGISFSGRTKNVNGKAYRTLQKPKH